MVSASSTCTHHRRTGWALLGVFFVLSGCRQAIIDPSDRHAKRLILEGQRDSLGRTYSVPIEAEDGRLPEGDDRYSFTPHPLRPLPVLQTDPTREPEPEAEPIDPYAPAPGGTPDAPDAPANQLPPPPNPQDGPAVSDPPDQATDAPPRVEGPPAEEVVPDGPGGELPRDVPSEGDAQAESAPRRPGDEADPDEIILLSDSVFTEQELELGTATVFTLHDAVEYAFLEAREIQDAREELYLAALDLTLERHLWTPQFVASVQAEYADYGQVRDFDHAMSAVSEVAVSQRLPYGGEVTARVINALMRDLGQHITSGEPGNFILRADIPLLRGAGRVALESRYQSERALIYAVRSFERFRQAFLVEIARDYFDLQQSRASITNAHTSYVSRLDAWRRAYLIATTSKARSIFDEPRARSSFRDAEAALVSSKEQYATALDRFKIRIGMTVDRLLDVVDQQLDRQSREIERLVPEVPEQLAVKVGLRYRLDLINSLDRVDDASRGVVIAENRILPDLDLSGSVSLATDPTHLSSTSYNTERSTWRGMIELRMDDRMSERTAYRQTLIQFRQEQRRHGQLADTVRSDVRRALRRIAQQRNIRDIQEMNVEENVFRREAADARFKLGDATNQDVIDAENDLLAARNRLAGAVAAYRTAILEFHRDVGTLRLGDEEPWVILPIEWPAAESLPPDEGP